MPNYELICDSDLYCTQTKREDSDLKTLQQSMSKSDEMYTVYLNEIACSGPLFKKIKEKAYAIRDACETILGGEELDLVSNTAPHVALQDPHPLYMCSGFHLMSRLDWISRWRNAGQISRRKSKKSC